MEFDPNQRVLFDDAASDYHQFRPHYPDSAIDDVIANTGVDATTRLLEIGCGTGQATVSFARHGFWIDSVELGPELAALAVQCLKQFRNVSVHNVPFASYNEAPGTYGLIYSAQAFHWIEPELRLVRCHELLAPQGSLALIYNYTPRQEGALLELSFEIEAASGGALSASAPHYDGDIDRWSRELNGTPLFRDLTVDQYRWEHTYTAEEYVGLFRTYSDFRSLAPAVQGTVANAVRHGIEARGGTVNRRYICTVFLVRKASLVS